MAPLTPLRLYRGDPLNELVESFVGFTDLQGGGIGVVKREAIVGDPVAIPDSTAAHLPWTTHSAGDVTIDRTDPANPVAALTGLYLVTVAIATDAPLSFVGSLTLVPPAVSAFVQAIGKGDVLLVGVACVALSLAWPMSAGDPLFVQVQTPGGGGANFTLTSAQVAVVAS